MADTNRVPITPAPNTTSTGLVNNTTIPTMTIRPSSGPEVDDGDDTSPTPTPAPAPTPAPTPAPSPAAPLTMSLSNAGNVETNTSADTGLPVFGTTADSFTDYRLPGASVDYAQTKTPEAPSTAATGAGGTGSGTGTGNPIPTTPVSNTATAASFDAMIKNVVPNVLNSLYQPTYHIKLFLVNDKDVVPATGGSTMSDINKQIETAPKVILAESGVTGYNIKNLEIKMSAQPTSRSLFMTPTDIKLTITDPLGSSFLDSFPLAASTLNIADFTMCNYYLSIQFLGYDESGNIITNPATNFSNGGIWTYAVMIAEVDVKMNEAGGVYTLTLVPTEAAALISRYNTLHNSPAMTPFQVSGDTLGDLWQDYVTKINKARGDAYGLDTKHNLAIVDIVIVSEPIAKGPTWAIGKDPKDFKFKPENPSTTPSTNYDPTTGKYSAMISPTDDTQTFITNSIQATEEGQAVSKGEATQDELMSRSFQPPNFRESVLFHVEADAQVTGFDDEGTTRNYTRKIVYHIRSRSTQPILSATEADNAKDPTVQRAKLQKIIDNGYLNKRYDYIFTGLNTEIIEFNYDFNFTFCILMPSFGGTRDSTDTFTVNAKLGPQNTSPTSNRPVANPDLKLNTDTPAAPVDNSAATPVSAAQSATPANAANPAASTTNTSAASTLRNANARSTVQANSIGNSFLASLTGNSSSQTANAPTGTISNAGVGPRMVLGQSPMAAANNSALSPGSIGASVVASLAEITKGASVTYVEDLQNATSSAQDFTVNPSFAQSSQAVKNASGYAGFVGQPHRDRSIVGAIYAQQDMLTASFQNIKMEIRGDPYWLGQASLQRQVAMRSGSDTTTDLPAWMVNQKFYLHFRYPTKIGDSDFKPVLKDSPIFGGVFTVTEVLNTFADGVFKQQLSAYHEDFLDPARITSATTTNGGAGSSAQMKQTATTPSNLQNLAPANNTSTAVTPTTIQANDTTAVGNLTAEQTAALKASIGAKESNNNPAQGNNGLGFVGQYQTGAAYLADQGYTTAAAATAAKTDPTVINQNSSWTGKNGINSLSDYLANPTIQNQVMDTGLQNNYNSLVNQGVITSATTPNQTAGLLAAAHIAGATGAGNFAATGANPQDANGTSVAAYYTRGANSF